MFSAEEIQSRLRARFPALELHEHEPLQQVEDRPARGLDFGARCVRNLVLCPRNQSAYYLLVARMEARPDLRALAREIGSSRLTFAPPEALLRLLGQKPGVVGPAGLLNDVGHEITVLLDSALCGSARIALHPGENTKTMVLSWQELCDWIDECKNARRNVRV